MIIRVLFVIFLFLLHNFGQAQKSISKLNRQIQFEINGKIKGAPNNNFVVLRFYGFDKKPDTCFVKNGKFKFSGKINESVYAILKYGYAAVHLIVENGVVNIYSEQDDFAAAKIDSKGYHNKQLKQISLREEPILDSLSELSDEIDRLKQADTLNNNPPAIQQLVRKFNEKVNELTGAILEFIQEYPKNVAAAGNLLFWFHFYPTIDKACFRKAYNYFDADFKGSLYGRWVKHLIDLDEIITGKQPFFEIKGFDTSGNIIKLSSFKNNYVLVDLWASWCAPCRNENKDLLSAYNKFHDKGFTILSISMDDNKKKWINAITKDDLKWNNICDLKGFNENVELTFGFTTIPYNFLINPEGKVIAKDLKGDSLITILNHYLN